MRAHRLLLTLLGLASFLNMADNQLLVPLLPDIAADLSCSLAQVGWSASAYALGAALIPVLLGPVVDRGHRRRWFVVGALGLALAAASAALARSLNVLLPFRLLAGGCAGVLSLATYALLADHVPASHRGRAASAAFSGTFAALIIALPTGAALGDARGWRAPYGLNAALLVVLGLVALRLLPADTGHDEAQPIAAAPRARLLRRWAATALLVATLLGSAATVGLTTYLGAHLRTALGLTTAAAGAAYGGAAGAALLIAPFAGHASDALGSGATLLAANLTAAAAYALAGWRYQSLAWVVVAVAIGGAGYAARGIAQTTLATQIAPLGGRARLLAWLAAVAQLGGAAGAAAGGSLFAEYGFTVLALAASSVTLAGTIPLLLLARRYAELSAGGIGAPTPRPDRPRS
jgi:predicted MFS family arabinose efflux permease